MPELPPPTRLSLAAHDDLICLCSPVLDVAHTLSTEENAAICNAVEKRRREYATGRWLARQALAQRGVRADSIPSGPKREPIWPASVIGSITHADGRVAVAVTTDPSVTGLGIDLERAGRVGETILRRILTERERVGLSDLDPTLLFSAKEACYKVLFPIFREYVEFHAVEIKVNESDCSFAVSYVGGRPGHELIEQARGSYRRLEGCWLTCVVLQADPCAGSHSPPGR